MFGREEDLLQSSVNLKPDAGIVPRACNEIFTAMKQRYDQHGIVSEVAISYVEIFGDQITDLLKNGSRCGHSKAASQQFVLQGTLSENCAVLSICLTHCLRCCRSDCF